MKAKRYWCPPTPRDPAITMPSLWYAEVAGRVLRPYWARKILRDGRADIGHKAFEGIDNMRSYIIEADWIEPVPPELPELTRVPKRYWCPYVPTTAGRAAGIKIHSNWYKRISTKIIRPYWARKILRDGYAKLGPNAIEGVSNLPPFTIYADWIEPVPIEVLIAEGY